MNIDTWGEGMKCLGWNEIQKRAIKFVYDWKDTKNERAESQSFLNEFLNIFGVNRRKVAFFENPIEKVNGHKGFIDMLWKGKILVEMKSRGKDLENAYKQAFDYIIKLKDYEVPQYIMICDFENIHLYNLDNKKVWKFKIEELPKKIRIFGFLAGYNETNYTELLPLNQKAAEQMALLHDELKNIGYEGHPLEVYLVRLLFCLFAENTALFRPRQFYEYIIESREDGKDLAQKLAELFEVLNTPVEKRLKTLDEDLLEFPYVNGKLFEEVLPIAGFNSEMREILIQSCKKDWSGISPAIFGSMFQSIMNPEERRNLGAHYTSEENIMKVIKPLFLDDLWLRFDRIKNNRKQLELFHQEISELTFLDPACGCGNFLIITYRELRRLELKILQILYNPNKKIIVNYIKKVNVSQFYGIECEEFPAQIAKVAMWLIDHQMNIELSNVFGEYVDDLPLNKYANIVCENALTYNWEDVIKSSSLSYIIGNPPFVGAKFLKDKQKKDIEIVFNEVDKHGILDYVSCWYKKTAEFIMYTNVKCAFVSTNSITKGEQVAVLWNLLIREYNINIEFAYRTFEWSNEAKGNAKVYCVIIGFSNKITDKKKIIYDKGEIIAVNNINPYLIDGPNVVIESRNKSICNSPKIGVGNKPIDNGYYLFTEEEKNEFINKEPLSEKYFRKWVGADEFVNGWYRWVLLLKDCSPSDLRKMPEVMKRIELVKKYRQNSKSKQTNKLADTPTKFHIENMSNSEYIIIPEVTTGRRQYIPIGFVKPEIVCSNLVKMIPNATLYEFAILTSSMHMAWTRAISSFMGTSYRYSIKVVYNNFPWPDVNENQKQKISILANDILKIRDIYSKSTLSDLYDPLSMPPDLMKAHQKLDRAVEKLYSSQKLKSDTDRVKLLFEMYEEIIDNGSRKLAYT